MSESTTWIQKLYLFRTKYVSVQFSLSVQQTVRRSGPSDEKLNQSPKDRNSSAVPDIAVEDQTGAAVQTTVGEETWILLRFRTYR